MVFLLSNWYRISLTKLPSELAVTLFYSVVVAGSDLSVVHRPVFLCSIDSFCFLFDLDAPLDLPAPLMIDIINIPFRGVKCPHSVSAGLELYPIRVQCT